MRRNFYITEAQYKLAIREGILPNDTQKLNVVAQQSNNTNNTQVTTKNVEVTQQKLQNLVGKDIANKNFSVKAPNPVDKGKTDIVANSNNNSQNGTVSENKLITKKELQENRLKTIKKNSEVYTVKDFLNKIKIK